MAALPWCDGGGERLLCERGSEVYSDRLWGSLHVSSCSKPVFFFSKVISPTNYNGAVVTMVVVQDRSRRYNPPSSPPPQKVFNFPFFMVVRNVNQSCEYPQALSLTDFQSLLVVGDTDVAPSEQQTPCRNLFQNTSHWFHKSIVSSSPACWAIWSYNPDIVPITTKTPPVLIPTIVPPGQQVPFSAFLPASFFLLLSVTHSFTATVVSSTNKSPLCHLCPSRCWRTITLVYLKPQPWSQRIRFKSVSYWSLMLI